MSQNDEKECGGWLDEEEKRKVLKKVQVECRVEKVWWRGEGEGEGEGGKGLREWGLAPLGWSEGASLEGARTLRVELKVAGDVVEQAPGTASGQREHFETTKSGRAEINVQLISRCVALNTFWLGGLMKASED